MSPRIRRRPLHDAFDRGRGLWSQRRLPAGARIVVVEQLARLIRAGIPMIQAIDEIRGSVRSVRMEGSLRAIRDGLESGGTLAEAIGGASPLFGPAEQGPIGAGEKTGRLADVLDHVATGWRRGSQFRRKLAAGSVYPLLLLVSSAFLLPLPKLFVGGTAPYLWEAFASLAWMVALVAAVFALRAATIFFGWQPVFRRLAWWTPGISALYRRKAWSDLYNGLAMAFSAGFGVHEALDVGAKSVADPTVRSACRAASSRVESGDGFADALDRTGILPSSARVALAGAERSGTLEESLTRLSEDQARELNQLLRVALAIANVVVLLVVVGWVASRVLGSAVSVLPGGGGSFDELERQIMNEAPFKTLN